MGAGQPVKQELGPVKHLIFSCLRWALGAVFIYAGVTKLISPIDFGDSIASYHLVPVSLVMPLALWLPLFEMLLGLLLVIGWQVRAAALGIFLLCGVFCLAISSAMLRGFDITCGCFGDLPTSLPWALLRAASLSLVALALFLRELTLNARGNL